MHKRRRLAQNVCSERSLLACAQCSFVDQSRSLTADFVTLTKHSRCPSTARKGWWCSWTGLTALPTVKNPGFALLRIAYLVTRPWLSHVLDWISLYNSAFRLDADKHVKAVIRLLTQRYFLKTSLLLPKGVDLVPDASSKLQAAQEILAYGTHRFITVFTTAHHS